MAGVLKHLYMCKWRAGSGANPGHRLGSRIRNNKKPRWGDTYRRRDAAGRVTGDLAKASGN